MSRGKGSNLNVETLKEEIQVKLVFWIFFDIWEKSLRPLF